MFPLSVLSFYEQLGYQWRIPVTLNWQTRSLKLVREHKLDHCTVFLRVSFLPCSNPYFERNASSSESGSPLKLVAVMPLNCAPTRYLFPFE